MLKEYVTDYYEPAAARSAALRADDDARAKALVRWKRHLFRAWPSVGVLATSCEEVGHDGQVRYEVSAQVTLGDLEADDVEVQVLAGPVDAEDELTATVPHPMTPDGPGDRPGWQRYRADLGFETAGTVGYTVRIVPRHPDVRTYAHIGRVAWASAPGT